MMLRQNQGTTIRRTVSIPRRILMLGSVPLSAPWNGADKNLARMLVNTDPLNHFIVQTDRDEAWPDPPKVVAIRGRRVSATPTAVQKLRAFAYLLRWARQADLVQFVASLRNPFRPGMALMRLWRRIYGRPVVQTVPSIGDRRVRRSDFFGDVTVVVSKYSQQLLTDAGVPNVVCIYPPVDERSLQTLTKPDEIAERLNLGSRAVLYPAHYGPESGIEEIIRAFAQLPAELNDAVLVLACRTHPNQDPDHEAEKAWELARQAGIEHRTRIVAEVDDMPALIKACAITALVPGKLASKMDLPLVILESLLLERPVIVRDQPPMREALLGQGGLAVPHGDVSALTSALERLLGSATLRSKLGRQGQEAVRKVCDPSTIVERFQEIYQLAIDVASIRGRGVDVPAPIRARYDER
jgi:glycosyltransferase involved in cell wall biosynthesis